MQSTRPSIFSSMYYECVPTYIDAGSRCVDIISLVTLAVFEANGSKIESRNCRAVGRGNASVSTV